MVCVDLERNQDVSSSSSRRKKRQRRDSSIGVVLPHRIVGLLNHCGTSTTNFLVVCVVWLMLIVIVNEIVLQPPCYVAAAGGGGSGGLLPKLAAWDIPTHRIVPLQKDGGIPTFTPNKLRRTLQSWVIRQGIHERNSRRMGRTKSQRSQRQRSSQISASDVMNQSNQRHGSFITFSKPTKQSVFEWFGVKDVDHNEILQCLLSRQRRFENLFNHPCVGITNPMLHINHSNNNNNRRRNNNNNNNHNPPNNEVDDVHDHLTVAVNAGQQKQQQRHSTSKTDNWWPSLIVSPNSDDTSTSLHRKRRNRMSVLSNAIPYIAVQRKEWNALRQTRSRNDDWRVLVYRARVGIGKECYDKVRDAMVDWEFTSPDGTLGVVQVPETTPLPTTRYGSSSGSIPPNTVLPKPYVPSVTSRYSIRPVDMPLPSSSSSSSSDTNLHRSLGSASRRLVTFTSLSSGSGPIRSLFNKNNKNKKENSKSLYCVNPVMVVYDVMDQREHGGLWSSTAYATMKGHWLSGEERVTVAMRDGSEYVDVEILSVSRAGPSLWGKLVWPFIGKKQTKFFEEQLQYFQRVADKAPRSQNLYCGKSQFVLQP